MLCRPRPFHFISIECTLKFQVNYISWVLGRKRVMGRSSDWLEVPIKPMSRRHVSQGWVFLDRYSHGIRHPRGQPRLNQVAAKHV